MKSTIENLEDAAGKRLVKLSLTVDEAEFDRDIDRAFRKIANEVRLPGFRAGKVPRKVLEARIGLGPAREQALRDAIPQYLANAVREHDIDLIATPQIEITGGEEDGPVSFDATCELRPEVSVPGYDGLRVELPNPAASDDEIDQAVRAELRRHGSLVDVDRPVQSGDHVTLSLNGTRDGEPVVGLTTEDWLYEVGQGWVAPSFDAELLGATKGAELRFTATPNGTSEEADFEVTVSNVQEMVLPELTDGWVDENIGEFDTVDAYQASIAERISTSKLNQARNAYLDRVTTALAELVDIDAPEPMVASDLQGRVQNMVQQFQAQGISIDQWPRRHRPGHRVVRRDAAAEREGRQGRPRPACRRRRRRARRHRRRPRCRVRADRGAGAPEAGTGAPSLRAERRGDRSGGPDPQDQGARLAAPPRRDRRPRRRADRPRPRPRPHPRRTWWTRPRSRSRSRPRPRRSRPRLT
ncbi:MAG: trigger factor [Ilumatobacteraceae bacterium]